VALPGSLEGSTEREARVIALIPKDLTDPYEVLLACDGNEALAAEQLGVSLPDFYRRLGEDPEAIMRGLAIRDVLTVHQALTAAYRYIAERIQDEDRPMSDATLVNFATRTLPTFAEMTKQLGGLAPGRSNQFDAEEDQKLNSILRKLLDASPIAGEVA
jgi:hypothetical protein